MQSVLTCDPSLPWARLVLRMLAVLMMTAAAAWLAWGYGQDQATARAAAREQRLVLAHEQALEAAHQQALTAKDDAAAAALLAQAARARAVRLQRQLSAARSLLQASADVCMPIDANAGQQSEPAPNNNEAPNR